MSEQRGRKDEGGAPRGRLAWVVVFAAAFAWLVVAAVGLLAAGRARALRAAAPPPDRGAVAVVGSQDCARCHPAQHATWFNSFHRTMTQAVEVPPGPSFELLAPFAGEQLSYRGFVATMDRDAGGWPRITVRREGDDAGPAVLEARVVLTVGSHRYQQYVARIDEETGEAAAEGDAVVRTSTGASNGASIAVPGEYLRLPVAWHRAEARWIHLNGAFVEPEGAAGDAEAYLRHVTRWNDNCVFCHNTEPSPGLDEARFSTRVGELGIACEACHGKGGAHTRAHANPLERMLATGAGDDTVALPSRMSPEREADVCGRCHGNRIARDIAAVLREGDGFVPGEALGEHSRPIFADSTIAGTEGTPFAARFWPDGTPRLSAYEYQAMQLSACHREGDLRCGSCHTMHGDDPDMQLRSGDRNRACKDCHATDELSGASGPGGHGGHTGRGNEGTRVDCIDCHMPRTTYGLLEGMVSHRIRTPRPGAWLDTPAQPDACTQCHVDRTRAWAAAAMPALRQGELAAPLGPGGRGGGGAAKIASDLFGADPLTRNLAAHAMARPKATGAADQRLALLVEAMDDPYPAVRWFAWRGARALADEAGLDAQARARVEGFDYLAPPERRLERVAQLRAQIGVSPDGALGLSAERRAELGESADDESLWIGE